MKTVITSEYEALFRQHFRLATLYAERIVGSAHEAEDIVQEVFIALLDVDFSQIRQKESYLYRCVRNAALDHLHARMKNRFYDINSKETVRLTAEDYAAWTRGLFTFNDETIASICRKLSRWYGVEIVPRGVDADKVRYTGVVKRYETFAEMARLLARTDQIRADVEEGKIVLCIDRDDD